MRLAIPAAPACCALLVLASLAVPRPAAAESAVACHCFREREYRLDAPHAADPYILATTRSSTLAAVFGTSKATLVRASMSGTAPDDQWIAHWAGARVGKAPEVLLEAKGAAGSWKAALGGARDRGKLGSAFAGMLAQGAADADLAAFAVDDVVVSHLRAAPDVVRVTRAAGASSPELILSLVLAPRLGVAPPVILARVRAGASWGTLLHGADIAAEDIDDTVARLVTVPARPSPTKTAPAQSWLLK